MIHPSVLVLLFYTKLIAAYPSPELTYLPKAQCAYPGQLVCASESTFAICDAFLTGIIQPLADGDTRCGDFESVNAAPAPAASSSTVPPSASSATQETLGFEKTVASKEATASQTPSSTKITPTPSPKRTTSIPPKIPKLTGTSSPAPKNTPKQATSNAHPTKSSATTPSPHFASGQQVVPTTLAVVPTVPPRDGCNPGKSTCAGG